MKMIVLLLILISCTAYLEVDPVVDSIQVNNTFKQHSKFIVRIKTSDHTQKVYFFTDKEYRVGQKIIRDPE
jgi:hypothetical protein